MSVLITMVVLITARLLCLLFVPIQFHLSEHADVDGTCAEVGVIGVLLAL